MESITTYNYIANKVIINGNVHVAAPASITGCLVLDDLIILLLDPDELGSDANIYCYDIQGRILWIIPALDGVHKRNYYTSIYVLRDLNLYGYTISGIESKIDFKTGQLLSSELIK